jgi:hypothetical protein
MARGQTTFNLEDMSILYDENDNIIDDEGNIIEEKEVEKNERKNN